MSGQTDQQLQNILYETAMLNRALLETIQSLQVDCVLRPEVAVQVKVALAQQAMRLSKLRNTLKQ